MTDYTKVTDFAAKDGLSTGDPNKLAKGTEVGTELDLIATAIASKLDTSDYNVGLGIPRLNGSALLDSSRIDMVNVIAAGPLAVRDTTLQADLNADQVDGQEGSYYLAFVNGTGTLSKAQQHVSTSYWDKVESHTKGKAITQVTLTDSGGNVGTDADLGNVFYVELDGDHTFSAPTHPKSGQVIQYIIKQAAGGPHVPVFNAIFTWPDGVHPTFSTGAGDIDLVSCIYSITDNVWLCTIGYNFS